MAADLEDKVVFVDQMVAQFGGALELLVVAALFVADGSF